MELFRLFGTIFVDNARANESIHQTEENAERTGNSLLAGVGKAAKFGVAIAGAASVAIGGMIGLASKTAETADFIDKLSERTGVNREELQRWKYAADQSGADVSKFEVGIKKLSSAMDGAKTGSKSNEEAFKALGISMQEVKTKSPSEMLDTVMKKLADMPDSVERNVLGNQLLGKSYSDMLPLLNSGSKGIEELKNRADSLGLVMSEDAVKANVKFGDTLADVKSSFSAVFMHISNEFLPILQLVLDFILEHMPEIQSVFQVVFSVIRGVVTVVIEVLKFFAGLVSMFFKDTGAGAKDFQETMKQLAGVISFVFESLKITIDAILNAIKTLWEKYGEEIKKALMSIITFIKPIFDNIVGIIQGFIDIVMGIVEGDWDKVRQGFIKVIKNFWEFIKAAIGSAVTFVKDIFVNLGKIFFDAGVNLLKNLWDGIKGLWENLKNWFIEKINWIKEKLFFWEDSKKKINERESSSSRDNRRIDGSHAEGLNYVPFDGYIAELHKGERVLTADENKKLSSNIDYSSSINQVISLMNSLIQEIHNQPYTQREILRKGVTT